MKLRLKKWNRIRKRTLTLRNPDAMGNPRKVVVWYDDLSKAKKPPAWMKEILFSSDASCNEKAG